MERQYIQHLRDLPIEEVAARLGIEVSRHKALCPFHDDHHASLSFSTHRNSYRCFACDAHGDTIDLTIRLLRLPFPDACRWLSGHFSIPLPSPPAPTPIATPTPFDPSRYAHFFDHPRLSDKARQFLFSQRLLDPRVVRFCRLSSWRDRHGVNWLQIPYFDTHGRLVGIQNRNLDWHPTGTLPDTPRFRFPQGSRCGIYNLPVLNRLHEGEPLWIAEGTSDCWALLSAGHKAIAIPSATLLKPTDIEPLHALALQLQTPFHMAPDRDLPGERLFLQLQQLLPNLTHHQLPPSCKDYSDYYILSKSNLLNPSNP